MTERSSWRRRFSCMAMSRPRLASCKSSLTLSTWRRRLLISRSFSDRLSLEWLQYDQSSSEFHIVKTVKYIKKQTEREKRRAERKRENGRKIENETERQRGSGTWAFTKKVSTIQTNSQQRSSSSFFFCGVGVGTVVVVVFF